MASGSKGNATLIRDGKTSLLLDAGIAIRELDKRTGFTLSDVSGCLISHEHADHCKAVKAIAMRGIDVYSSAGTLGKLGLTGHRYKAMPPHNSVTINTLRVVAFDVRHDAAEPFGFLVESIATGDRLVYFSDTAFVKYRFDGLTHIVAECNHGELELRESVRNGTLAPELAVRIAKNHMGVERLVEMLEANDLSRLRAVYLIHMSERNGDKARFRQTVQRATGAEVYAF